jgi:6-phosphogluconolactonase
VGLQDNGGNNIAVSSNSSFTFTNPILTGSAYDVAVLTQPLGENCAVQNGSGTVVGANVSNATVTCSPLGYKVDVSVVCPWHILYSADGAPTVSAYYLDQATGHLSAPVIGSPFKIMTGAVPSSVVLTPNRQYAYAADTAGNISAFSVNSTTGSLTALPSSPFSVGTNLTSIAIDPTGSFLYAIDSASNTIAAFTINSSTGALTSVAGSPFASSPGAGSGHENLVIDPTGHFLYAAGETLLGYTINTSTGALSPVAGSPFAPGENLRAITVTPSGPFLISAGYSAPLTSLVYMYFLNESTGALRSVAAGTQNGISFTSLAVNPTGNFLYVADNGIGSNNIEAFAINSSSGALTAVPGSPYPVNNPTSLVVDPSGGTLYAGGGGIYEFTLSPTTGALTAIGGNQGSTTVGSNDLFLSQTP